MSEKETDPIGYRIRNSILFIYKRKEQGDIEVFALDKDEACTTIRGQGFAISGPEALTEAPDEKKLYDQLMQDHIKKEGT